MKLGGFLCNITAMYNLRLFLVSISAAAFSRNFLVILSVFSASLKITQFAQIWEVDIIILPKITHNECQLTSWVKNYSLHWSKLKKINEFWCFSPSNQCFLLTFHQSVCTFRGLNGLKGTKCCINSWFKSTWYYLHKYLSLWHTETETTALKQMCLQCKGGNSYSHIWPWSSKS